MLYKKLGLSSKKGLSTVVTTLIIVLLVLVAVGIIWVVIRGVIEEGTEQISLTSKCLKIDVSASKVVNISDTNYDVTLRRSAEGDAIAGVKLVFFNSTDNSVVIDFGLSIDALGTATQPNIAAEITGVTKVEVTPFFTDDSGTEQLCSQTITYNL